MLIMFDRLKVTDHAKTAQNEVVKYLQDNGYTCKCEHNIGDRGDGRDGRLDIFANNDQETIAIEIDKASPRSKSITKLRRCNADKKFILLRKNINPYKIDDIEVIGLGIL
jgi:hypothetical protein